MNPYQGTSDEPIHDKNIDTVLLSMSKYTPMIIIRGMVKHVVSVLASCLVEKTRTKLIKL